MKCAKCGNEFPALIGDCPFCKADNVIQTSPPYTQQELDQFFEEVHEQERYENRLKRAGCLDSCLFQIIFFVVLFIVFAFVIIFSSAFIEGPSSVGLDPFPLLLLSFSLATILVFFFRSKRKGKRNEEKTVTADPTNPQRKSISNRTEVKQNEHKEHNIIVYQKKNNFASMLIVLVFGMALGFFIGATIQPINRSGHVIYPMGKNSRKINTVYVDIKKGNVFHKKKTCNVEEYLLGTSQEDFNVISEYEAILRGFERCPDCYEYASRSDVDSLEYSLDNIEDSLKK